MKYEKKHQKRLINLSGLILFLLVLNINFTLMFNNFEFKYAEDNFEENYEDLNPELIVESPKNAIFGDHLNFDPYGTYVYGPRYFQRFVGQSSLNSIFFRLHDGNEGWFSEIKIFVDDIEQFSYNWNGDTIDFNIGPYLSTNGVHHITVQALSDRSKKWVTHHSILNVTPTIPCIAPFYDDFMSIQDWSINNLEWNIDANNPSYNYSISINGIEVETLTVSNYNNINFDYISDPAFINTVDYVNEIKLEVNNGTGEVIINQFNITVIADSQPSIESLYRNCENYGDLTLMETEGFTIGASASSSQNDLEKIVIIANNLPIHTILNVSNDDYYEAPININSLIRLLYENAFYDYNYVRRNFEVRAIAVTKYGQCSPLSFQLNIDVKFYDYYQLIKKTEDVSSGRNIETLTIIEERNPDIEFSLTVVTDVLSPTTLTIAGSTGEAFERIGGTWEHCYLGTDDGSCNIFGGYEDYEEHNEMDQIYIEDRGGMVFWVGVENQSAVQFPMIVKIDYPEEIKPDGLNKNWNLQFMHWEENCGTNERGWYVYQNESISEERDETLTNLVGNAIEVLIYSQGLFAFGIEPGEDYKNDGFFISSFPIGLIIVSIGVGITTISLKSKYKMKKK